MKHKKILFCSLLLLLAVVSVADIVFGGLHLHISHLTEIERHILLNLRLPRLLTAIVAGISLSVAGLMMQTLFRNPLAGPYILGVSSGASLGVGLLVLLGTLLGYSASSWAVIVAAIIGAYAVLVVVIGISSRIKNNVALLIVGMMIGSIAGALVNILQNFANPDALKLFIVWSMGNLSSVTWTQMPVLLTSLSVGLIISVFLIKPLNGLQLGENYARALGVDVRTVRLWLVISTGLLAGSITAFCGPIAFIGVAIPHLSRGILQSGNHRLTLPMSALLGSIVLVICDLISNLFTYPLPISTVSALFAAPVIIWVIINPRG